MGEFAEYVQERADKALARKALTTMIDLFLFEEVSFTATSFPLFGFSTITLPTGNLRIDTDHGRATVSLYAPDGRDPLGSVDITMGSRGVSYPFCAMTSLINAAVSGGRSENRTKENDSGR